MMCAAKAGHRELVEYFISLGATSWDWGMEIAVQTGHRELEDFFAEKIELEDYI